MRVNVYREEQTNEVKVVEKRAETDARFVGIRFYLHSASELHDDSTDDDRSAVTFWGNSRAELHQLLLRALDELDKSK
jgi:hypothetical protein